MKIIICGVVLMLLSVMLVANTIRVGRHQVCTTITHAIELAHEKDTIIVEKDIYHERNLIINKAIVLKGIGYPVLEGDHLYEIISIKADRVTIDGFRLQHSGQSSVIDFAGIKIYNRRKCIIINNILDDNFFGIYSQNGIECQIKNNIITAHQNEEQQSGNGIHCWKSDSMQIVGNTITGHRDGIYFEFVTHSLIWRNYSFRNLRYGLHFMFSSDDSYITNRFEENGSGVSVMYSHGVQMYNNYFKENWGDAAYGILLKEISDSYIQGNHFEKNTSGIYMEGASRIQVKRNMFKNNGWGLKIQASCMDIVLESNNFLGNTFDVGTNGSLVLNKFDGNYWDKYEGYDLNKDKIGDIPYRPVSMFSMIIEKNPSAMMLFRSLIATLMDKTEKVIPSLTPEGLKDNHPLMKALPL